eukprot:8777492-Pyramimonas_sp.AAC.1
MAGVALPAGSQSATCSRHASCRRGRQRIVAVPALRALARPCLLPVRHLLLASAGVLRAGEA